MKINFVKSECFIFCVRVIIASIFILSGFSKLGNPIEYFEVVISLYKMSPENLIPFVAYVVPSIEIIFGSFLLLGYSVSMSAAVLASLSALFQLVLAQALLRGLRINECGCFGGGYVHLSLYQSFMLDTVLSLSLIHISMNEHRFLTLDKFISEKFPN